MSLSKNLPSSLFLSFSTLIMGCSYHSNQDSSPALFNTKSEAINAAAKFNCKGAHQMGDKWMPCEGHKEHNDHSIKIGQ